MQLQPTHLGQRPPLPTRHRSCIVEYKHIATTRTRHHRSKHRQCAANSAEASSSVQQLSLLLLACENLRRRLGRSLLDEEAYLKAPERLATAPYALLLLGPSPTPGLCNVLYANDAAAGALQACSPGSEVVLGATLQLPACLEAQQLHSRMLGSHRVYDQAQWQPLPSSDALSTQQLLLFSLQAPNDDSLGVGAIFDAWTFPDGCIGRPGVPRIAPGQLPDGVTLQQAADAVRAQADAVRQLKQSQGLGNKDPAVVQAVAKLQQLKDALVHLERVQLAFADDSPGIITELLDASTTATAAVT